MFIANGNRRPAPSLIVKIAMKSGRYIMPHLQKQMIANGMCYLKNIYGNVTEADIVKCFTALDAKVSLVMQHSNLDLMDKTENFILYNITQNKHKKHPDFGTIAHVYIIPKTHFVSHPVQYADRFVAKLHADVMVNTRDDMRMSKVFQFKRHHKADIIVKSKTEADFFSASNGNVPYEVVDVMRVDGNYLINNKKVKVTTIRTDLHTVRFFDQESEAKQSFGTAFKFTLVGSNYASYANANIKNLEPGLYRCIGKREGYLFIEVFQSAVTGKVRLVHFLDSNKEVTEEFLLQYPVKNAWTNPVY
jgi:hypothetical protein